MIVEFSVLKGQTLSIIVVDRELHEITFRSVNGKSWKLSHHDDCCETVIIKDIVGDLSDLIGVPILQAEEVISEDSGMPCSEYDESYTWTFYKLATIKGYVTISWYGTSNGYYSESVDFEEVS